PARAVDPVPADLRDDAGVQSVWRRAARCTRPETPRCEMTGDKMKSSDPLLAVRDLRIEFATYGGRVQAVRGVDFDVYPGEVLAIVGESGCGKSVTCQALMGLIPCPPGE